MFFYLVLVLDLEALAFQLDVEAYYQAALSKLVLTISVIMHFLVGLSVFKMDEDMRIARLTIAVSNNWEDFKFNVVNSS